MLVWGFFVGLSFKLFIWLFVKIIVAFAYCIFGNGMLTGVLKDVIAKMPMLVFIVECSDISDFLNRIFCHNVFFVIEQKCQ